MVLGLVIGILIGILIGIFIKSGENLCDVPLKNKIRVVVKEGHLKPKYYGYNGGYTNTNKCSNCNLIGLYEDLHQINPCHECGGKVERNGSAKWIEEKGVLSWVKPNNKNIGN